MFMDQAKIHLSAGNGGDGAIAWRREKYEPSGGPDGGDGGDGGSIFIEADEGVQTLLDYKYQRRYKAASGEPGRKKKQYGKKGEDLVLKVPVGTVVREANSRLPLFDLIEHGQRVCVVKGGRGGKGNVHFKSSIRQAPRFAQPGGIGQSLDIQLELKLIADVGLVGLPNVGKSTILSILSNAKPKIANYHFTTLSPNLGVVRLSEGRSYILADIPGLIEGAGEGAGLGHDFLRHIERTRALAHVLDMSGSEGRDPLEDFVLIQEELATYHPELPDRVKVVIANKMDLEGAAENKARFIAKYPDLLVLETAALLGDGMENLQYTLEEILEGTKREYETLDEALVSVDQFFVKDPSIQVYRRGRTIHVEGEPVRTLLRKIIMDDEDSIRFFERSLETMGIMDRIRELEPTEEDTIAVEDFVFDWL